jgi:hypothetical protein
MAAIEVDFEVYKALTMRRESEDMSYNDVLRDMLGLKTSTVVPTPAGPAWTWKGVTLPSGTELKAEYKGKEYTARIVNGEWLQGDRKFGSPSAAAYAITESGINGWVFWNVKRPSDAAWMPLSKLRA